jgi:hypothetical protein
MPNNAVNRSGEPSGIDMDDSIVVARLRQGDRVDMEW